MEGENQALQRWEIRRLATSGPPVTRQGASADFGMSVVVSNSLSTTELMLEFCKPATSVMVATTGLLVMWCVCVCVCVCVCGGGWCGGVAGVV